MRSGRYTARVRYPHARYWHDYLSDDIEEVKEWLGRQIMRDENLIEGQILDGEGYLPLLVVTIKHRRRRNG